MTVLNSADKTTEQKERLRNEALARRDALPAGERQAAAAFIAARAFPVVVARGAVVSGFMPMKSEINPLPLLKRLAAQGAQLDFEIVDRKGGHQPGRNPFPDGSKKVRSRKGRRSVIPGTYISRWAPYDRNQGPGQGQLPSRS